MYKLCSSQSPCPSLHVCPCILYHILTYYLPLNYAFCVISIFTTVSRKTPIIYLLMYPKDTSFLNHEKHLFQLNEIKKSKFQENIYFCFIDYVKAFDYVDQNCGNSSRDGNTTPPDLPPEISVCRSRSNS